MSLETITDVKRIAITVGPGGVGKTTVAALLGLQASVKGRKALVLTIDPAMRLASALGLSGIPPGDHHLISKEQLIGYGVPAQAPLAVSMLETGRSLAEVVIREVPASEHQKRILEHPFFRRMCDDLSGSREYAAVEEIHHLYLRSGYDLLVVDTPPTVQSLEFLEAPDRILDVLEHDSYRWLMRPALLAGKLGLQVLDFSGGYVVGTLSKFTGWPFLKELATFIDLFVGLMEGFRQRAAAIKAILMSQVSAFVLVTTLDHSAMEECLYLYRRLFSRDLTPDTVVVNRVTSEPPPLPRPPDWREVLTRQITKTHPRAQPQIAKVLQAMEEAHAMLSHMAERDRSRLAELSKTFGKHNSLVHAPLLAEDVHDIFGLEKMRRAVFECRKPRSQP